MKFKKQMMRVLSVAMMFVFISSSMVIATPIDEERASRAEMEREIRINDLLRASGEVAHEMSNLASRRDIDTSVALSMLYEQEAHINNELARLGVDILDPYNPADVAFFQVLMTAAMEAQYEEISYEMSSMLANAPCLSGQWGQFFTIYRIYGVRNGDPTVRLNLRHRPGSRHILRHEGVIHIDPLVTDPHALVRFVTNDWFQLSVTTAAGFIPLAGGPVSFTLSSLFNLPAGINHVSGDRVRYTSDSVSTVQMNYIWVFRNGDWRLAGSFADVWYDAYRIVTMSINTETWPVRRSQNSRYTLFFSWDTPNRIVDDYVRFGFRTAQNPGPMIHTHSCSLTGRVITRTFPVRFANMPNDLFNFV